MPVDFIGAAQEPLGDPRQHQVLLANMLAQSSALALGRASEDLHRHYPGNRPSNTLLLDALTPHTLGMLIALYEHKVFTLGVLWGVNSFDQWGVEYGKVLSDRINAALTSEEAADASADMDASTQRLIRFYREGLE